MNDDALLIVLVQTIDRFLQSLKSSHDVNDSKQRYKSNPEHCITYETWNGRGTLQELMRTNLEQGSSSTLILETEEIDVIQN